MSKFDWGMFGMSSSFAHPPNEESVKAIRDLHRRVGELEESPCIRRDRIVEAAMKNERVAYDDLQARVDEFVKWAGNCHREKDQGWFKFAPADVLVKLRELGLVKGGQGGAAHPEEEPSTK
jgi:hypothetical protein